MAEGPVSKHSPRRRGPTGGVPAAAAGATALARQLGPRGGAGLRAGLRVGTAAMPLRIGVLISGRGSNLRALIRACSRADFPARIVRVISNEPDAGGIDLARAAGLSVRVIDHRGFPDRAGFDAALNEDLRAAEVELVCLAGFTRLFDTAFAEAWGPRMLNIHPSLLPAFKGLGVHRRVLEAGARLAGCTVHFVTPEMDIGPIIAQAAVPVLPGDTEDSLAARVLAAEHRLYPDVLRRVALGRVTVATDGRVLYTDDPDGDDDDRPAILFGPFPPGNPDADPETPA